MKVLPASLLAEKNKISSIYPWLVLVGITLDGTTHRLTNNNEDTTYNGYVWSSFGFDLESTKQSSKGEVNSLTLKLPNVSRSVQWYLEDNDGAVGAPVTISVVNAGYLDTTTSALTMEYQVIASEANEVWASLSLSAESPLAYKHPFGRYLADHCRWDFTSVECAYAGNATLGCKRTYNACKDYSNEARYGGFMGLATGFYRLV